MKNLIINEETFNAVTINGEYLVNLTPHEITIIVGDESLSIPPSGGVARCKASTIRDGRTFCGIPVSRTVYGEVEGLPDAMPNVGFIVSGLVKGRCPEREDVFAPSETIRNAAGQVAGCTSLGV